MKSTLSFLLLAVAQVLAQEPRPPEVKSLMALGTRGDRLPVLVPDGAPITISFDLDGERPRDIRLKFFHCDKDWNITDNAFLNDEFRNSVKFPISFDPAPQGVKEYRFSYTLKIPGSGGVERFSFSGNYMFELWDMEQTGVLAQGKFFVVESILDSGMKVTNRYLPSSLFPRNMANRVELIYDVSAGTSDGMERIFSNLVTTVDLYRNRELGAPYRIDINDRNPNTFVDGLGTNNLKFIVDNVIPGNEYRVLDLRDVDFYPHGRVLRSREGADVSRFLHQGEADHDGASSLVAGDRYADYLDFQFELLPTKETVNDTPVYVVGDFNGWMPGPRWRMEFDEQSGRYNLVCSLRRGVYDYAYLFGLKDLVTLEGNGWRTVNTYSAFVYYHDPRFGGFDRIVGFAQARSPGGTQATSK